MPDAASPASSRASEDGKPRPRRGLFPRLVAVLVLVLGGAFAVDELVYAPTVEWFAEAEAVRPQGSLEREVLASHRTLLSAQQAPHDAASPIVLLGPGRALHADTLSTSLGPEHRLVDLTHAGMQPFELLAMADDVRALAPSLVIVEFCCFDTHRPLRLGHQTAPGSGRAVRALEGWLDDRTREDQADLLQGLATGRLSHFLRWRRLREEPTDGAPGTVPPGDLRTVVVFAEATPPDPDAEPRDVPSVEPPAMDPQRLAAQSAACAAITRGPHAPVQAELIMDAVVSLRDAGIPVLLVEAPLHPATRPLFDRPIRVQLVEALAPLVVEHGAVLLTEQQTGPYGSTEFVDLLFLSEAGRRRLVDGLVRTARGMLDR
jgi:hypothetical protein